MINVHNYRGACSITDSNSVVITGYNNVRYNTDGFMEDLPRLFTARSSHACALYTTDTGAKV